MTPSTRRSSVAAQLAAPVWSCWLIFMAPLVAIAAVTVLADGVRSISDYFFLDQDIAVALAMTVLLRLLAYAPAGAASADLKHDRWVVYALAALVGLAAYCGVWIVCENYPLAMDEFMARFDARIFLSGHLVAPIAPKWRDFAPSLQPIFVLHGPGNTFWISGYLPINAVFQALGIALGSAQAISPVWTGLSILAVYGVGRELWPDRPRIALYASLLLATSSQFLVMGMTPYAMQAHLALDLIWLWLVLKGSWKAHGLAVIVAFLACGLHQLVFNLLFAAPFLLQMWIQQRWRAALWHTAAYVAIAFFWVSYWPMVFDTLGVRSAATSATGGFVNNVLFLARNFKPSAVSWMADNLIRLATWQNLLTLPLALWAAPFAIRSPGPLRSLLLGPVLMILLAFVVLPFQGHGWGYRYLHGFLGSICLAAAWGWDQLLLDAGVAERKAASGVFAMAAIASVLLIPLRAWQVNRFIHPYAAAERAIRNIHADVVLVDDQGVLYGADLVRNDPLLQTRPLEVLFRGLDRDHLRRLCATNAVALFSGPDALSYDIRPASDFAGRGKLPATIPKPMPLTISQACGR